MAIKAPTYKTLCNGKIVYARPLGDNDSGGTLSRAMPQNIGIERRRLSNEGGAASKFSVTITCAATAQEISRIIVDFIVGSC
jgi:hypothetical protein